MAFFVRKHKLNKILELQRISDINTCSADLITNEYKTRGNTLSFWKIESLEQLDEALMVIALTSTTCFESFDLFFIDEDYINKQCTITMAHTLAPIPLSSTPTIHYDMTELNYKNLKDIAILYQNYMKDKELKTYSITSSPAQLKELLQMKENISRVDFNSLLNLKENDKEILRKYLEKANEQG